MMNRKIRFATYILGSLVCLIVISYRAAEPSIDRWAIRRVQRLSTAREEFKHRWMGVGVIQWPADLISFGELLYEVRPEIVIETGTNYGGLAVFFATLMEQTNPDAKIVTIDIDSQKWDDEVKRGRVTQRHLERIVFIKGDSVGAETLSQIESHANGKRGLVILDSDHSKNHVLKEMQLYSRFVSPGSYMIVADTHLDRFKVIGEPGPMAAVEEFMRSNQDFEIAGNLPTSLVSCCESGFLKRMR